MHLLTEWKAELRSFVYRKWLYSRLNNKNVEVQLKERQREGKEKCQSQYSIPFHFLLNYVSDKCPSSTFNRHIYFTHYFRHSRQFIYFFIFYDATVLMQAVLAVYWRLLLEDECSKTTRNVGNTVFVYTVSSLRNSIHIVFLLLGCLFIYKF